MDPSTLRFELFGRLAIRAGPAVYRCPPLTAALLTRLLITPETLVAVDELVRDVWPSATRRAVGRDERIAVQKRISALRRLLDPDHPGEDSPVLQTERGAVTAYRLLITPAQVDIHRYQALAEQALQTDEPARRRSLALDAAAVWRDRPLLDVHEHPFAAPVVHRLTMLRQQLHEAVRHDPSQPGNIVDRDPAQHLTRVPDRVRDQVGAAAPYPVGVSRPVSAVWSVPPRWSGRLPRTALLTALRRQLAAGRVVLCGPGGIGKSALATEYAHQFATGLDIVWWIDAEDPDRIGAQYAALADELRLAGPGTPTAVLTSLVRRHLRTAPPGRWLLIFDNAEDPAALMPWLPDGPGQVLITSRNPGWDEVAQPLPVPLFTRAESRQLLDRRLPDAPGAVVDEICGRLGDLPLALAQAAGVLAVTGMSAQALLAELTVDPVGVAGSDPPVTYPRSLAAAVGLSMHRLRAEPKAMQAARLCAVLAADPLPLSMLAPAGGQAARAARAAVGRLRRLGLITVEDSGVRMHRLVRAIIADRCSGAEQAQLRCEAGARIAAQLHGDRGDDPRSWPVWQALLPHLLAADPDSSDDPEVLTTAVWAVRFVNIRGGHAEALQLGERLHNAWTARLGPEYRFTLAVQTELAMAVYLGGNEHRARDLLEHAYMVQRRRFGVEDPQTQVSATNLCMVLDALGQTQRARDLAAENLTMQDRTVGPDDVDRLQNASALSDYMHQLGDLAGALDLLIDTHLRMLRVVGAEHPWTLQAGGLLALYRAEDGDHELGRQLAADTLERQRALLGDNHIDTLSSMVYLAEIHAIARRTGEARTLLREAVNRSRDLLGSDHLISRDAQRHLDDLEHAASSAPG